MSILFFIVTNDENAIDHVGRSQIAFSLKKSLKPSEKLHLQSKTYCFGKGECFRASADDTSQIQSNLSDILKRDDVFEVCSCSTTIQRFLYAPTALRVTK